MKTRLHNRINKKKLKKEIQYSEDKRITLSFYKYHRIEDPKGFRDLLYLLFSDSQVLGRIYVAKEGINAQLSVPAHSFQVFRESLYTIDFLNNVRLNTAIEDDGKSFFVLKIKIREKIVADGLDDDFLDISKGGLHIDAKKFNALTSSQDTVIVDMRNHYESEVGHFDRAICPDVATFRESLTVVEDIIEPHKDKDIVMYCTGGIRCEKATAYFMAKGFKRLYQLEGGIIEYSRQVKNQNLENKFRGKNFVFDERLGERITEDVVALCHQCGEACDTHINCANDACHLLFIQCHDCAKKYHQCCSQKCAEFIKLPAEQQKSLRAKTQFNGSRFGKGRYKAHRGSPGINLQ